MTVVTISRGSYSMGKVVADKLAARLKYSCVSREVLLRASDRFNIPEIALEHAIKDAPSLLDRITGGKQSYLAYAQSALAQHVQKDDVVYHGLAGHLLLRHVGHVVKVRVVADQHTRVEIVRKRDGLSAEAAEAMIVRLDNERRKWTRSLYHLDPWDPTLYDMLLNVSRFGVDGVVAMIARAVEMKQFHATKDSQRQMDDLVIACRVKAGVVDHFHDVRVASHNGNVLVYCAAGDRHALKVKRAAQSAAKELEGVNNIEVHAGVPAPEEAV